MTNPIRHLAAGVIVLLLGTSSGWGQADLPWTNAPNGQSQALPVRQAAHQASPRAIDQAYLRGERIPDLQTPQMLSTPTPNSRNQFVRTVSSLVVVAGLMLGFIWWTRKNRPDRSVSLPNDLVEVIGRVTLDAKHKAHVVRFGDRILLLTLDGPGVSKLGEIGVPETAEQTMPVSAPFGRGSASPNASIHLVKR